MEITANPLLQPQLIEPHKRKVAYYCRVANAHQLDNKEIYVQLHKLNVLVKQQGFINRGMHSDNVDINNNPNRFVFSTMQTDIKQGETDAAIVSCINRITCDAGLMVEWISYAKARGVRLIALKGFREQPFFLKVLSEFLNRKREVL